MKLYFYETDIGKVGIAEGRGSITNLYFETDVTPQNVEICETETIKEASRQLNAYLSGDLKEFSLPLATSGTDFMRTVWKILCEVPYGKTASYKDIAIAVGNPKAVRAVGMANNKNPIPIFIPCHRIIGSDGKLTGYRGGLALKKEAARIGKAKITRWYWETESMSHFKGIAAIAVSALGTLTEQQKEKWQKGRATCADTQLSSTVS